MEACAVCGEISERSSLYGRWLFAENHADGATMEAVAAARGFCTLHASRMLAHDADIAGSLAHFVFRVLYAEIDRELQGRRRYQRSFEPSAPCPWCAAEQEALAFAVSDPKRRSRLCKFHCVTTKEMPGYHGPIRSPLLAGVALKQPASANGAVPAREWWAPSITELGNLLRSGCPSCAAAREAGVQREAFLLSGPRPLEHWEEPRLCIAHDSHLKAALDGRASGSPETLSRGCDWCSAMRRAAHATASLFVQAYGVEAFRLAYACVPGFCLPHVARILRQLPTPDRDAFARDTQARVAALLWELDERALRRSWHFRDQGQLSHAADLSHRAWWFLAGGVFGTALEQER